MDGTNIDLAKNGDTFMNDFYMYKNITATG
jgi:hypothetical protein